MRTAGVILLAVGLLISISLNIYLLSGSDKQDNSEPLLPASSEQRQELSTVEENGQQGLSSEQATMLDDVFSHVDQLVEAGHSTEALSIVQQRLRRDPTNIELLILEADLMARRLGPMDALIAYYDLLKLPLSDAQREAITEKIEHLADFHIENLRRLKSWDILSDFLEPLWQLDPMRRNYIVPLAEAYALQSLQAPMENVLASLYPDEPDVSRIRQLYYDALPQAPGQETNLDAEAGLAQGTPLRQLGDHFIVRARLNNARVDLMIDTGASTTVLTEAAFARLVDSSDSTFIGQYRVNTAGGQVTAPVYRLNGLDISGYQVNDIAVVVLPMPDFNQAQGLLGMNFLREFDFRIDQNNAQLFLNDRR